MNTSGATAQNGVCWDNVKGMPIDGLYTRRQATATRFVTVLEPYKSQRVLSSLSAERDAAHTKVRMKFVDGHEISIDFDDLR